MTDAGLLADLLRAVGPNTAVVFIGDDNQLPPVGPGYPLRDILEHDLRTRFGIEKPHIETGTAPSIKFSGMIPGGMQGEIPLFSIYMKAAQPGQLQLDWNKGETKAYLNGPEGKEDAMTFEPTTLDVVAGQSSEIAQALDIESPEAFSIFIAKDPLIADGRNVAVFTSQDKKSGIDRYEISERRGDLVTDFEALDWVPATSPYVLSDQALRSYVYVKAIDRAGNVRVSIIAPTNSAAWYNSPISNAIAALVLLAAAYLIIRRISK